MIDATTFRRPFIRHLASMLLLATAFTWSTTAYGEGGPITIQSDKQVYDQEHGTMKAIGHAVIKKDGMTASSPEAIIVLGSDGSPGKVVFIKGAKLVKETQTLTANKITIDLESGSIFAEKNTQSNLTAEGEDGKPTQVVIKSFLQEFDSKTSTLIANGKVQLLVEDYVAKAPKAVFYTENETLDRIVLTGGAEIEDNARRVTGDKVIITVNPKQFNAEGNVTSLIKTKQAPATVSQKPARSSDKATQEALRQEMLLNTSGNAP